MAPGTDGGVSVVRRWQLAAALKDLREQADLTQEQAIEKLRKGPGRWSKSKMSRIENREHNLKPREVEQLLDVYGVTDMTTCDALVQLAADSREQGWWTSFVNDLPADLQPLLSIEGGLVALRDFQNQLVHGLLQTPDYTRAVINAINPGLFSPEQTARGVAARMVRQQILIKDDPPQLHFILDQTILERVIGDRTVMRDQLRRLLDLTEKPNITIQILPRDAGGSPGLEGPFSILTLPKPIPDIVHTEGTAGILYIEDREHVRILTMRFGVLTTLALSREDSANMIIEALKDYQ